MDTPMTEIVKQALVEFELWLQDREQATMHVHFEESDDGYAAVAEDLRKHDPYQMIGRIASTLSTDILAQDCIRQILDARYTAYCLKDLDAQLALMRS